ncbi:hypothetical protein F4679DRAFT_571409 [Xylaria curta]|nr:hypothetical protein F4679DRAFT_571409 [Xylaria curta]
MSQQKTHGVGQLLEPVLDYCYSWRTSSQRASNLYESGVKLWQKEDLVDIEQQLAQSHVAEKLTVRRLDGRLVYMKNLIAIWYLVDRVNQTLRSYEGPIENIYATCAVLIFQFRKLLDRNGNGNAKKVTKIVCFGLGDMNFKPPGWWRIENNSKTEDEREPETSVVGDAFIHHAIVFTIADIVRSHKPDSETYSDETKDILQKARFEVVGECGTGGFAELDHESIVFSAFATAPVKQIIADLARPAVIVCAETTSAEVYNPLIPSEGNKLEGSLHQLEISTRIGGLIILINLSAY